ncbi:MAG: hypothetical protein R3F56_13900 [Planctomycetota bacterium]
MNDRLKRASAIFLVWSCSGCGSAPPPVAPAVVAAEEQRLLRPFQTKRVVIADSVEVVVSANFVGTRAAETDMTQGIGAIADNRLALPGIDRNLHTRSESRSEAGVETTYLNKLGGVERPLTLLVGQTEYRALQGLTIRVLPSGATMTLDVQARGDVTVLAGAERLDLPQLTIKDGLWHEQ